MLYRWLADGIVLIHLGFILFVIAGGILVVWRRRFAWLHIPALAWGAWIEFSGWICPLTPLENWLRTGGGSAAYRGDFIAHYLLPVIYPPALTRGTQIALGAIVLVVNAGVYAWVLRCWVRKARSGSRDSGPRAG